MRWRPGARDPDRAYYKAPGLPQRLVRLPLEYFARAVRLMRRQPGIDPERVVTMGSSYAGEASPLAASASADADRPAEPGREPAGGRGRRGRPVAADPQLPRAAALSVSATAVRAPGPGQSALSTLDASYARLRAVKSAVDPGELLRSNHPIPRDG